MTEPVWLVTRWNWGMGGDDDRDILAVCTTREKAYEVANSYEGSEVAAFPLDEIVTSGHPYKSA